MSTHKLILYKELSFNVMAILFHVHNQLGNKYQEKHYQKAVEALLIEQEIPYQKELKAQLLFHGKPLGHYFLDFVIDSAIVLELKAKPFIEREDSMQVYSYLKASGLKLGILANFRTNKLTYRRIINLHS